ncbi:hypothetical protein F511_33433 [Dorcoceras hygrometricum]|uniref:Uncharacterized protein n=1 Tax=Dorcoceras hygrometricum TaxID=472368 RepID=A0A2Z7C3Y9_9LAMI|nr:hypothetical protein F511_33433 [Dorcoceras hygrometricum]
MTCEICASPANCRRFRAPFVTFEVALDSSRQAISFLTDFIGCRWLEKNHEAAIFGSVVVRAGCEGERRYRTLISLLGLLATMRRVVNYHSSWARQRQVELFDASGIRLLFTEPYLLRLPTVDISDGDKSGRLDSSCQGDSSHTSFVGKTVQNAKDQDVGTACAEFPPSSAAVQENHDLGKICLNDPVVGQRCAEIQPKDIHSQTVYTAHNCCKHSEPLHTASKGAFLHTGHRIGPWDCYYLNFPNRKY